MQELQPPRRDGFIDLLVRTWMNPLVRNGYALVAAAGSTAVLGLIYWILAARMLPKAEVGLGAALVSLMMTVSNIAQVNLGNVLNRYLPIAGRNAGRLIGGAYAIAIIITTLLAGATIVLLGYFAPNLMFLQRTPMVSALFVAATVLWTICTLQDAALTGLRRAAVVPIENTAYAIAKILALALLPTIAGLAPVIFVAWVAPLPFLALIISTLIFVKFLPKADPCIAKKQIPTVRSVLHFWFFDYVGTACFMAAIGLAPLLVLRFSDLNGVANYHLSWTISFTLYQIGRSMGSSFVTEAMTDERLHRALVRQTIKFTMVPLIFAVVLVIVAAPWLMAMFGSDYVGGASLMRLLALSCLPSGLMSIYLADARVRGRLESVAAVQAVNFVLLIGLGLVLVPALGSIGMGVAWLASNSFVLLLIVLHIYRSGRWPY